MSGSISPSAPPPPLAYEVMRAPSPSFSQSSLASYHDRNAHLRAASSTAASSYQAGFGRTEPPAPDFVLRGSAAPSAAPPGFSAPAMQAAPRSVPASPQFRSMAQPPVQMQGQPGAPQQRGAAPLSASHISNANGSSKYIQPTWAGWSASAANSHAGSFDGGGDMRDTQSLRDFRGDTQSLRGDTRSSQQGEDGVPLYGPSSDLIIPGQFTKDLYEGRMKLLKDDNLMLRETLRREQQAREDIARLMREECAQLSRRIKEEQEARGAAEMEVDRVRMELDNQRAACAEAMDALQVRENLIEQLRGGLERAEQRIDALATAEQQMPALMQTISQLTGRVEELEGLLENEKTSRQAAASAAERTLTEEREARQEAAREAADARLEKRNAERTAERARDDLAAMERRMQEETQQVVTELESERERRRAEAEEGAERALEGMKKLSMVQEDYKSLSTQHRELKVEHRDLRDSAEELRAKLLLVSEELARVSESSEHSSVLQHRVTTLQEELARQQGNLGNLSSEQEKARDLIAALQQSNVDLIAQRNHLEERVLEVQTEQRQQQARDFEMKQERMQQMAQHSIVATPTATAESAQRQEMPMFQGGSSTEQAPLQSISGMGSARSPGGVSEEFSYSYGEQSSVVERSTKVTQHEVEMERRSMQDAEERSMQQQYQAQHEQQHYLQRQQQENQQRQEEQRQLFELQQRQNQEQQQRVEQRQQVERQEQQRQRQQLEHREHQERQEHQQQQMQQQVSTQQMFASQQSPAQGRLGAPSWQGQGNMPHFEQHLEEPQRPYEQPRMVEQRQFATSSYQPPQQQQYRSIQTPQQGMMVSGPPAPTQLYQMGPQMQQGQMKMMQGQGQWQSSAPSAYLPPLGQVNVLTGEQRALHEMTPQEIAMAGFDPSTVIGV